MTVTPPEDPTSGAPGGGERRTTLDAPTDSALDDAAALIDSVAGEVNPELEAEMEHLDNPRRLLLVHAHPDDETIGNGATMAKYVADGAHVSLVTCTLGEEGEVLVSELAHLAAAKEDALGQHRIGELATAMEALGVRDFRFLGGAGAYRDSGMMGEPTNERPDCFWQADFEVASTLLADVIREVRPQVVVTYDENGGYGHPDHIQAHRVTMRGVEIAAQSGHGAGEPWQVAKVYYNTMPRSVMVEAITKMRDAGTDFFGMTEPDEVPFVSPDELVTTRIDALDHVDAKMAAMRAHATQIEADGPFFAMASVLGKVAWGVEYYRLVRGELGQLDQEGHETDLFSGVA